MLVNDLAHDARLALIRAPPNPPVNHARPAAREGYDQYRAELGVERLGAALDLHGARRKERPGGAHLEEDGLRRLHHLLPILDTHALLVRQSFPIENDEFTYEKLRVGTVAFFSF